MSLSLHICFYSKISTVNFMYSPQLVSSLLKAMIISNTLRTLPRRVAYFTADNINKQSGRLQIPRSAKRDHSSCQEGEGGGGRAPSTCVQAPSIVVCFSIKYFYYMPQILQLQQASLGVVCVSVRHAYENA